MQSPMSLNYREYTFKHHVPPPIKLRRIDFLIKGYWDLWVAF